MICNVKCCFGAVPLAGRLFLCCAGGPALPSQREQQRNAETCVFQGCVATWWCWPKPAAGAPWPGGGGGRNHEWKCCCVLPTRKEPVLVARLIKKWGERGFVLRCSQLLLLSHGSLFATPSNVAFFFFFFWRLYLCAMLSAVLGGISGQRRAQSHVNKPYLCRWWLKVWVAFILFLSPFIFHSGQAHKLLYIQSLRFWKRAVKS